MAPPSAHKDRIFDGIALYCVPSSHCLPKDELAKNRYKIFTLDSKVRIHKNRSGFILQIFLLIMKLICRVRKKFSFFIEYE